jgi:hypothetical protein
MAKTIETELTSAETYQTDGGYLFPFTVMDPTPGGSNLGRIEWHVELYKSQKRRGYSGKFITKMLVWARQTRDPRYDGKVFILDCYTRGIMTCLQTSNDDFSRHAWFLSVCEEHGGVIISSYPSDHHVALMIETHSEVGTRIRFVDHYEEKQ